MQTYNGAFEAELCKLIAAEIEVVKDEMAAGAMDLERYTYTAGRIQGFKDVLELCELANKNLDER